MTETPATPSPVPTDHPAPPMTPPSRNGTGVLRTVLAWTLLMLISAAMVLSPLWTEEAPATPETPIETVHPEQNPDAMLTLVARYLVGIKPMIETAGPSGGLGGIAGSLEDAAQSPLQELRAAMVIAELESAEAARKKLDAVIAKGRLDEGLKQDAEIIARALSTTEKPARELISTQDAERLASRHHWFAKVLLSHGLPDTDPARSAAMLPASRTVAFLLVGLGIAALAFFIGLVIAGVALVMLFTRSLRPAFQPLRSLTLSQNASLLESLVLFLLLLTGIGLIAHVVEDRFGLDIQVWLIWLALPTAAWPMLWRVRGPDLRLALGWHTGRGVFREIGAGFVGYLGGLPILGLGLLTTMVLIFATGERPSHPVIEEAAGGGGWWGTAQIMILATVWAPICEETLFRGAAYTHCRRWMHPVLSGALVAFIFAAIHPQGWTVIPALMSLAVVFALIREWRGSIIASATAHAIQNGFVMTLNILMLGA